MLLDLRWNCTGTFLHPPGLTHKHLTQHIWIKEGSHIVYTHTESTHLILFSHALRINHHFFFVFFPCGLPCTAFSLSLLRGEHSPLIFDLFLTQCMIIPHAVGQHYWQLCVCVCARVFLICFCVCCLCTSICGKERNVFVLCPLVWTRKKSVFQHTDNSSSWQSCFPCAV